NKQQPPRCSICQDAFTEPVSTPCGHNYCKSCITGYWDSSDLTQCPLCLFYFRHLHFQNNRKHNNGVCKSLGTLQS
uniref:RING-type domain-containing protein n=1 Tax=Amphiprion percula TaxID=161767 RepID=A0A3P8RZ82_AMPPE